MYFACLLINAVYEVYPPKNKETLTFTLVLNFVTGGKNDVKQRNVNEGFENKLPFSVLLCMRVY